jgi:capsular polysaccharide transport system permease protein
LTGGSEEPVTGASSDNQSQVLEAVAAAEERPGDVAALMHAAMMLLHAGDVAGAKRFARDAVAIDRTNFPALRILSGILDAAGERAEAINIGHEAIGLAPTNAEVRLHVGAMLAAERRWQEAAEHLSLHVVSPAATATGWRLLSSVLHQAGNTPRAIDAARESTAADPDNVEYRLNLVSLLNARALHDQALSEAYIALARAPANPMVWRALSGVHASLDQFNEALRAAERAIELAGDDTECRAHLAYVKGRCALPHAAGDLADAAAAWSVVRRRTAKYRAARRAPGLSDDVLTRGRVIYAIILRDIRTRFGHTKLGYFWAIMEPITHLLTLGLVFYAINQAPPPVGDNLFLYYITGLVPFLMFSHVSHDVMNASQANNAMLQLPIVKRTDIMIAHALRQLATELCVGVVIFSIAALLGQRGMPADPLTTVAAVSLLWLLAVGIGAFNLVVVELFPSYETLYASLIRMLYVTSGIYFSPIAMPDWVREGLAWNPILQGIELFRSGFFPQYEPHWLDVNYLALWAVASVGIGFALERSLRARMAVFA